MRAWALLVLLPGAALAQGAPEQGTPDADGPALAVPEMNETICRFLLSEAGFAFGIDAASVEIAATPDGGCEAREPSFSQPDGFTRTVEGVADVLRWRGEGLSGLANGSTRFGSLEIEVEGYRLQPRTGDDVFDWLLARQAERRRIDGRLAAAWDAEGRELRVTELTIDLPGRNAVALSGTLANVDLSSRSAAVTSLASMALTDLSAEVTTDGLFEDWLLLPLGNLVLPFYTKPDIPVSLTASEIHDGLVEGARTLPSAIFTGDAPEALAALAAELPHPLGTLTVEVDGGEAGIGAARFARFGLFGLPATPEELWPALDGVTVAATWTPLPPAED